MFASSAPAAMPPSTNANSKAQRIAFEQEKFLSRWSARVTGTRGSSLKLSSIVPAEYDEPVPSNGGLFASSVARKDDLSDKSCAPYRIDDGKVAEPAAIERSASAASVRFADSKRAAHSSPSGVAQDVSQLEEQVRELTQRNRELERQNQELIRSKDEAFDEWAYAKFREGGGDGLDIGERAYFQQHRDAIESALGGALRNVVGAADGARSADPVAQMADLMKRRSKGGGGAAPQVSEEFTTLQEVSKAMEEGVSRNPAKAEIKNDLRGMIQEIMRMQKERKKTRSADQQGQSPLSTGRHTPAESEAERNDGTTTPRPTVSGTTTPKSGTGWSTPGSSSASADPLLHPMSHSTASWLEQVGVKELVERALLAPLIEHVRERQEEDADVNIADPELEMDYLDILSEKDPQWISMMFSTRTNLLKQIGEGVYKAASRFKEMRKRHPNRIDQPESNADSKYFDEGNGEALIYGTPDVFFSGLDGFIGPPNPNLEKTVEKEHCNEEDAGIEFVVPNYKTRTTSRIEYWFVANAELVDLHKELHGGLLNDLKAQNTGSVLTWPKERTKMEREAQPPAMATTSTAGTGGAVRVIDRSRQAKSLSEYEELMGEKNEKLREKNMQQMQRVEILAARLYTGPMVRRHVPSAHGREPSSRIERLRNASPRVVPLPLCASDRSRRRRRLPRLASLPRLVALRRVVCIHVCSSSLPLSGACPTHPLFRSRRRSTSSTTRCCATSACCTTKTASRRRACQPRRSPKR